MVKDKELMACELWEKFPKKNRRLIYEKIKKVLPGEFTKFRYFNYYMEGHYNLSNGWVSFKEFDICYLDFSKQS